MHYILFSISMWVFVPTLLSAQSYTNIWELGYYSGTYNECSINFSNGTPVINPYNRPMNFDATCASICDTSGNLLFYSNGVYIANANHDTMMNGSGINPSQFTNAWNNYGLPISQGALILPWPDSANKYLLIHETLNYDMTVNYRPKEVLYSVVDMSLDSGLGGVTIKNGPFLIDTLEGGITACRHGNGRDWWVLIRKHVSDIYFRILITSAGITTIDTQRVAGPINEFGGQAVFSPDGKWYASFDNLSMLRIYKFNRCTGLLDSLRFIQITDSIVGGGISFSASSQRLYVNNSLYVYQFNLLDSNIALSKKLVATYDGYYSPWAPFACDFWYQMLGPDGKIYINSGSSVVDLHVINAPDNLDTLCDLQQHSLFLNAFNVHTLPNHINYQLGRLMGSVCDTLTSVQNEQPGMQSVRVFPNPNDGYFSIYYSLPQNKKGSIKFYDVNGREVYSMNLPQWSTIQKINVSHLADGMYIFTLTIDSNIKSKGKFIVNR